MWGFYATVSGLGQVLLPLPAIAEIAVELANYRRSIESLPAMSDHPFALALHWERGPPHNLRRSLLLLNLPPEDHAANLAITMPLRRYVGQTSGRRYVRIALYELSERYATPTNHRVGRHDRGIIVTPLRHYILRNATLVAMKG